MSFGVLSKPGFGGCQPAQLSHLILAISAQPAQFKIVPKLYRSWIDSKSSQRSFFEVFCRCLLGCSQNLDLEGQPAQLSYLSSPTSAQPAQPSHLSKLSSAISPHPAQLSHLSSAISAQPSQLSHFSSASSPQPSQPAHLSSPQLSQLSSASSAQPSQLSQLSSKLDSKVVPELD